MSRDLTRPGEGGRAEAGGETCYRTRVMGVNEWRGWLGVAGAQGVVEDKPDGGSWVIWQRAGCPLSTGEC